MNAWEIKRRTDEASIYLLGKIEQLTEDYAKSAGISPTQLRDRVAELLSLQAGGEIARSLDNLPTLRGNSARNGASMAAMEVARYPHSTSQIKPHWTQQPKHRAKMMRTQRIMIAARKQKAKFGRGGKPNRTQVSRMSGGMKNYWSKMTAEQRSKEVLRRQAVASSKK
jgi:hypothetical protein